MGTIQRFNQLAVVCLFALAAGFTSANTPLMAATPAVGEQAQVSTNLPTGQDLAAPAQNAEKNKDQKQTADEGQASAVAENQPGNGAAPDDPKPAPAAAPFKRDLFGSAAGQESLFSGSFFHKILRDEKTIWLSPFRLHGSDATWLLPIVGGTAALMPFDHRINTSLPNSSTQLAWGSHISQLGAPYTAIGVAAGTLLLGHLTDNDKTRETGMMATEALIHSEIVMTVLKFAAGRERPMLADGTMTKGSFGTFQADGSFPSGHSLTAWSLASVFAHQYGDDHKWVPFLAYGLASSVSLSRIAGQKHFPSECPGWQRAGLSDGPLRLPPASARPLRARTKVEEVHAGNLAGHGLWGRRRFSQVAPGQLAASQRRQQPSVPSLRRGGTDGRAAFI